MNYTLAFLILLLANSTRAQSDFPDFLPGTWKMENKESYEHWDRLNDHLLKGVSYQIRDGQMAVSEYLEISRNDDKIIYTATVLNQNQGQGINFELTKTDSTFSFENPSHDFPKKISYRKLSDTEVFVRVSDGKQKEFAYKLQKTGQKETRKDAATANPNYDPLLAQKLGQMTTA